MHEVQVETGVGAQGEEVVIIIGGRGGGDGDVGRLRPAGRKELPRPAHGLDGLVISRGRADGGELRRLRLFPHDLDRVTVEPGRHRPRPRDPADRHTASDRVQQRSPDGREFGDADDVDGPEQHRRMVQAHEARGDEVGGPHHGWRQRVHDRRLQAGDGMNARMLGGARLKVDGGPPRLAQGVGSGAHHAGQSLDPVELPERRAAWRALTIAGC